MYGVTTNIMFKSGLTFGKEIFTATICKDMRCAALKASVTKLCRHVQILLMNTSEQNLDDLMSVGEEEVMLTRCHIDSTMTSSVFSVQWLEVVDAGGLI